MLIKAPYNRRCARGVENPKIWWNMKLEELNLDEILAAKKR